MNILTILNTWERDTLSVVEFAQKSPFDYEFW